MYAFNRRFQPSKLLFMPPLCFVGMIKFIMGLLMVMMVSYTAMKGLGVIMMMGGVLLTAYAWRYRDDAELVKTYGENMKDKQAIPFGLKKGMTE